VLPEALVELAAHTACDVRDDPVQCFSALLIDVQILVHERAKEPARLRAPVRIGPAKGARRRMPVARRTVLQPGYRIAERGHREPQHRRPFRGVRDLIQTTLLEAALEMDVGRIGNDPPALEPRKSPPRTWDGHRWSIGLIAHRELRAALVEIGRG